NGRAYVTPDDIRFVTFSVLNHRLILTPESEMDGIEIKTVVEDILKTVEVPR
ncbi:MAG: magnesium chelatase, partial [Bacteroidia bacterium]|nr:magnesium chelatase [Bacteroidia bacterium]